MILESYQGVHDACAAQVTGRRSGRREAEQSASSALAQSCAGPAFHPRSVRACVVSVPLFPACRVCCVARRRAGREERKREVARIREERDDTREEKRRRSTKQRRALIPTQTESRTEAKP